MNASEYKRRKNNPAVFDLNTLVLTIKLLEKAGQPLLATSVSVILVKGNIDKSVSHNKPDEQSTNFYIVDLPRQDIEIIVEILVDFEVDALSKDYETTLEASLYASVLDKWNALIFD